MMVRIYLKVYKVKSMSGIENLVNKYDKKLYILEWNLLLPFTNVVWCLVCVVKGQQDGLFSRPFYYLTNFLYYN